MPDKIFNKAGDFPTKLRDEGDGTLAEVVSVAGSGVIARANFTPSAAAYGAGAIMDVAKEMQFKDRNGVLVPTGSLIRILSAVVKIGIAAIPAGQTSFTGRLFGVTPPSAQADKAVWTLATADFSAYRGPISLGAPVDEGAGLFVKSQYIDTDIALDTGTSSVFMELVSDGAHTASAIAREVILFGVLL